MSEARDLDVQGRDPSLRLRVTPEEKSGCIQRVYNIGSKEGKQADLYIEMFVSSFVMFLGLGDSHL